MVMAAAEAGAINLSLPMGEFLDSIASALPKDPSAELSLHILCCNEYAVITGIIAGPMEATLLRATDIRSSLE
jgi:hypothetical protein